MELISQLEQLVTGKECVDASEECQAVFGRGALAVLTAEVVETLSLSTIPRLNGTSPIEEVLLDFKRSFGSRIFLDEVAEIDDFFSRSRETLVAVPELEDFLVLIVPLTSIRTLFICSSNETPEEFGILR